MLYPLDFSDVECHFAIAHVRLLKNIFPVQNLSLTLKLREALYLSHSYQYGGHTAMLDAFMWIAVINCAGIIICLSIAYRR